MTATKKDSNGFYIPNPGTSWKWLVDILIAALAPVVTIMSAALRKELIAFLKTTLAKARETPNPWDDFIFVFFIRILGEDPDSK